MVESDCFQVRPWSGSDMIRDGVHVLAPGRLHGVKRAPLGDRSQKEGFIRAKYYVAGLAVDLPASEEGVEEGIW